MKEFKCLVICVVVTSVVLLTLLYTTWRGLVCYEDLGTSSTLTTGKHSLRPTINFLNKTKVINPVFKMVKLLISYSLVNDAEVISRAKELVRIYPALLSIYRIRAMEEVNISKIAVLKLIVTLVNDGNKTIYVKTHALSSNAYSKNVWNPKPPLWAVKQPVAVIRFNEVYGLVLKIPEMITLDLSFKPKPPHTKVTNTYYYIVTNPFIGTVTATSEVCYPQPMVSKNSECKTIRTSIVIVVTQGE